MNHKSEWHKSHFIGDIKANFLPRRSIKYLNGMHKNERIFQLRRCIKAKWSLVSWIIFLLVSWHNNIIHWPVHSRYITPCTVLCTTHMCYGQSLLRCPPGTSTTSCTVESVVYSGSDHIVNKWGPELQKLLASSQDIDWSCGHKQTIMFCDHREL